MKVASSEERKIHIMILKGKKKEVEAGRERIKDEKQKRNKNILLLR